MNKRNLLPILLFIACSYGGYAQTVGTKIISAGGNDIINSGKRLTYTIGETMITTYKSGNNTFTQGFNQPDKLLINAVSEISAGYTLNTYPNPSQDVVNIDISGNLSTPLEIQMFDGKGARINPAMLQNSLSKISFNMQNLAAGYYFVRLVNPADHSSSTIKIAKIQ